MNQGVFKLFWTLLVLTLVQSFQECKFDFFPMPQVCKVDPTESPVIIDQCTIVYIFNADIKEKQPYTELLSHYQVKNFKCKSANLIFGTNTNPQSSAYIVRITIDDTTLQSAFDVSQESYKLKIIKTGAELEAKTYVGFVRGIETFSQAFNCSRNKTSQQCALSHLPIQIQDQPEFTYRGIMIDTGRHFLPLKQIYETIDALMYNKMSVMHWHITDEDSFPLILNSHPEIAEYGAFSEEETYTAEEARDVVRYAMVRGVRVIPQLDTPGHAASWGKAPQNKQIACTFGPNSYMGPLDVTRAKTYKVLREVLTEILDIFVDPIVHFGGDEVSLRCLTNLSEFTAAQNPDGKPLDEVYRKKERAIMQQLNPNKHAMFWQTGVIRNIVSDDIIHWWGGGIPANTKNKIVISNYGPYYLDMGVGNFLGSSYGQYINWLDFYNINLMNSIQNHPNKDNVLGAEGTLWSEMSNKHTHHIKLWMRSSSLAERLWNSKVTNIKPGVMRRMVAHQQLMNRRGIPTAPITSQQCQLNVTICSN